MFDLSNAKISKLCIHYCGNKSRNEPLVISPDQHPLDEIMEEALFAYIQKLFSSHQTWRFRHDADLNMNELFRFCTDLFENPEEKFYTGSTLMATHLYQSSEHPRIKPGNLLVIYMEDCILEDELTEAIVLIKTEVQERFFRPMESREAVELLVEEGFPIKKPDKGCLVFNTQAEEGFRFLMADHSSSNNEEASFWKDRFLNATEVVDANFKTKAFLSLCKDYSQEALATGPEGDPTRQMNFLHRSVSFLNNNDRFDETAFATHVFDEPEQADEFQSFVKSRQELLDPSGELLEFRISKPAVQQAKKSFKPLIKLDDLFEIKVKDQTGELAREFLHKGYDPQRKLWFYTLYFTEEQ